MTSPIRSIPAYPLLLCRRGSANRVSTRFAHPLLPIDSRLRGLPVSSARAAYLLSLSLASSVPLPDSLSESLLLPVRFQRRPRPSLRAGSSPIWALAQVEG